jgi:hypothetical protein
MARRKSGASLAGWLFADLALVLAFIFLNANITGTDGNVDALNLGSTTTLPIDERTKGGADPVPLTVTVPFQMSTSVDQLITQLTAELSAIETQQEASRSFLVVLLYGGSDGVSLDQGRRLAERAQLLLGESWDRVVQGRTYYVPAVNYRQPYGSLQLKLFPVAGLK